MRKLIWLILTLAALYAGYWFTGAWLLQGQIDKVVAAEKAGGRQADFSELKVQGFPSRFDISAKEISLYDPASGYGWQAPQALVAALAYNPQSYIAVLPQTQVLRTPAGDITLTAADMRASLNFATGPSFVLDRMTFVTTGLTASGGAEGARTGAAELRLATQRVDGNDLAHRLGFEATGIILPDVAAQQLARSPVTLPQALDRLHLDAVVTFDKRLDRFALTGLRPQPTQIRLTDLSLSWGPLGVAMTGDVTLDAMGRATGPVEVTIRGIQEMLDIATAAGLIPAERRTMVQAAVMMFAKPDATGTAKLSVQLKDGSLSIGQMTLLQLPPIRL